MHWIIYAELKKYAETRLGAEAWPALLKAAGFEGRVFLPYTDQPDADAVALVAAAAKAAKAKPAAILEDFGEFIAPDLLRLYGLLVKPEWKTLDLIEGTEATIHQVLRVRDATARPPELKVRRVSPRQVVITYASPRKMCAVARGIARGMAKHYGEPVVIADLACMNAGAAACEISVTLA